LGVDRDYIKARQWYAASLAGGNTYGMVNLGRLYREGTGTDLKRQLARLGHYKGPIDDTWDRAAKTAAGRYFGWGR